MSKHKHYEMIVAKADNMNLVVFAQIESKKWIEIDFIDAFYSQDRGLFLCLPEHKEPCLHWLNGGSVQDYFEDEWSSCSDYDDNNKWSYEHMFMLEEAEYRIAPKKEKRWIAYTKNQKRVGVLTFDTEEAIRAHYIDECDQFIEIEVEV